MEPNVPVLLVDPKAGVLGLVAEDPNGLLAEGVEPNIGAVAGA